MTMGKSGEDEVLTMTTGAIPLERRRDNMDVHLLTNNNTGSNYLTQEPNSFDMLVGGPATDSIFFTKYEAYPCCRTVRIYLHPKHFSCHDTETIIRKAMEKNYLDRFIHTQVPYQSITSDVDPLKGHPHEYAFPPHPAMAHTVAASVRAQDYNHSNQYVY